MKKTSPMDVTDFRVYIDPKTHPIYEELVSQASKDAEDYPFATMKDLWLFGVFRA